MDPRANLVEQMHLARKILDQRASAGDVEALGHLIDALRRYEGTLPKGASEISRTVRRVFVRARERRVNDI